MVSRGPVRHRAAAQRDAAAAVPGPGLPRPGPGRRCAVNRAKAVSAAVGCPQRRARRRMHHRPGPVLPL